MPLSGPIKFVQRVVEQAKIAANAGTFGVGGLLLDHTGNILKEIHNNVIRNGRLSDPTAHGERQLISWYYQALHSGKPLPSPSELTIITSLDPCLMCTGAILHSGFNVIVIAYDDIGGINWKKDNGFLAVPEPARPNAKRQFAYFGVDGESRLFVGSMTSIFVNASIPAKLVTQSFEAARDSIETVRNINRGRTLPTVDIAAVNNPTAIQSLRNHCSDAVKFKIDTQNTQDVARLLEEMLKVAEASKSAGGSFNAAALIDHFRNILLILGSSSSSESPIDTPLMRLVQAYSSCRLKDPQSEILPHLSQCSLVLLNGPAPSALSLMDLGAYGLAVGPSDHPQNLYYFRPMQSEESLAVMVRNLPPVFRDVMKITPVKLAVENP